MTEIIHYGKWDVDSCSFLVSDALPSSFGKIQLPLVQKLKIKKKKHRNILEFLPEIFGSAFEIF